MKQNRCFKAGSLKVGIALLGLTLAPLFSAHAQATVDLEAIRKDLQAAKATGSGTVTAPSADAFSLKPEDLEKRRAALLDEENALLNELQTTEHSKTADTKAATEKKKAELAADDAALEDSLEASVPVKLVLSAPEAPAKVDSAAAAGTGEAKNQLDAPAASTEVLALEKTELANAAGEDAVVQVTEKSPSSGLEGSSDIATLHKSNANLEAQLKNTRARAASLQKQLEEARDRLMIADAEVERLSGMLRVRNQQTLTQMGATTPAIQRAPLAPAQPPAPLRVKRADPKVAEDVLIGTVVADKANLRTGPGKDNSPFMTVQKGTRLTVETRNGDWYRVITPTGTRAWVSSEVLAFGDDAQSSPTSTVRVKGYDASLEEQAFKLISNRPH